ncbi:MAG: glycosyltransferase family 1 protein [Bryobacteraceae bacterium]
MSQIFVNGRYAAHAKTGMQYYVDEVASRLTGGFIKTITPETPLKGARGHLWEQCVLPAKSRGGLLWSPNNTGPLAARRHVCTIHDIFPVDHPEWFSSGFSQWYSWLLPKLAARVDHIIAVSHFTRKRIVERLGVRPEKVTVVHNGVDSRFRRPAPAELDIAKGKLGIPFERYLLMVGSIEPRKNIAAALAAWPVISRSHPGLGLVIAGAKGSGLVFAGVEIDENMPNVYRTGYVPHELLPALYAAATALVFPSLSEGFGLPPLEAMACGTPVITSMNSALPEVVGDAAIGIDPLDPASIAAAVNRLLESESLQQDLRHRGFEQAAQFSWERCAAATRHVLEAYA